MAASVSSEQQMSLAVTSRTNGSHLNKPTRQNVPAFLQKLYEMVNHPADHDLIRWSDTGDSFFVLDQERFANEVLGRWFKHKNFSSFVRQLNMYGFHKIPHLQQGVLRADHETEFWNFEHPHFIRGQPDMLCLIQRKKQAPSVTATGTAAPGIGDDAHSHVGVAIGTSRGGGSGSGGGTTDVGGDGLGGGLGGGNDSVGGVPQGQLLDISSIVSGIHAIKRHQAAISADLNELKSSNAHLWQEAMAARERHRKHQDTINRIVKFLAGVFGHADQLGPHQHESDSLPHAMVPRKPQRLLIDDGTKGQRETHNRHDAAPGNPTHSPETMSLFAPSDAPTPIPSDVSKSPRFAPIDTTMNDATPTPPHQVPSTQHMVDPPSPLTNTTPQSPQSHNDSMVQAALAQVLSSPIQLQKLLHALQSSSFSTDVFTHQPHQNQHQLIAPYDPVHHNNSVGADVHSDAPRAPLYDPPHNPSTQTNPSSLFGLSLLGGGIGGASDTDHLAPYEKQEERLQRTYRTAAEISHDVDELQSNLNSFIETLGIDPTVLDTTNREAGAALGNTRSNRGDGGTGGSAEMMDLFGPETGTDFDFDSFLMDLPRQSENDDAVNDLNRLTEQLDTVRHNNPASKLGVGGASLASEQISAFLDEVASQDGSVNGSTDGGVSAPVPVAAHAPGSMNGFPTPISLAQMTTQAAPIMGLTYPALPGSAPSQLLRTPRPLPVPQPSVPQPPVPPPIQAAVGATGSPTSPLGLAGRGRKRKVREPLGGPEDGDGDTFSPVEQQLQLQSTSMGAPLPSLSVSPLPDNKTKRKR